MLYSETTTILSKIILMVAKIVGVPGSLLLAICVSETNLTHVVAFNDGKTDTYGMCQVKHETAMDLGFKGTYQELMKPIVNAEYAAKYLKYQLNRYDGNVCKATSAYNNGTYTTKNLNYVKKVRSFLDNEDKYILNCVKEELQ